MKGPTSPTKDTGAWLQLQAHPRFPARQVRGVQAHVRVHAATLECRFRLDADPGHLVVPSGEGRQRRDGLWRSTCCEMFIADADSPQYLEYNFSPAGDWAAYAFTDYRQGAGDLAADPAPRISMERDADGLTVITIVPRPRLRHARLGPAVVVEEIGGQLSYWAATHAGPRPDFHHLGHCTIAVDGRGT